MPVTAVSVICAAAATIISSYNMLMLLLFSSKFVDCFIRFIGRMTKCDNARRIITTYCLPMRSNNTE